jgi:hypothetical protein
MLDENLPSKFETELAKEGERAKRHKWARFTLAALGAIPWVGSVIAAAAALNAEDEQGKVNDLQQGWLHTHAERIEELERTIGSIIETAETAGVDAENRLDDPAFLKLVEYGFRVWDGAPTDGKREKVRRVLANATVTKIGSDDLLRLFLTWIDQYDDVHFKVIAALHRESLLTGSDLWDEVDGREVRHDSADADLFKLILRDLSTGGVVRQHREVSSDGRMRKQPRRGARSSAPYLSSPTEVDKPYELTQMGHLFVGHALEEPTRTLPA